MKANFVLFFSLFFSLSVFAYELNPEIYEKDASIWIRKHFISAQEELLLPEHDIHLIMNLIYFSYQRSIATLQAQHAALKSLEYSWQGWQNIAQTRLNPTAEQPFLLSLQEQKTAHDIFIEQQKYHHIIGCSYAHSVEHIVNGSALKSPNAPFVVDRMRLAAREVVVEAFMSIRNQCDIFNQCVSELKDVSRIEEIAGDEFKTWSIAETLISFLPGFALSQFLKIEKCYTQLSTHSWNYLFKVQQVSMVLYQAIEQARASFYLAHYRVLHKLLEKHIKEDIYKTIVFNEHGLIALERRTEHLPEI